MANRRLDQLLVELNYAPSRAKAQELIAEGSVELLLRGDWQVAKLASQKVGADTQIRVHASPVLKYVSRGGLKLEAAIDRAGVKLVGKRCFDLGQSTGGFTDCCLQHGARSVLGVDVGSGQLHSRLRSDPRVVFFENVNARELSGYPGLENYIGTIQFLVADVSFISLKKVIPPCIALLDEGAELLLLVKPQFELGKAYLNKKGIVVGDDIEEILREDFCQWVQTIGFKPIDFFTSSLRGQDGNQEYFLYAKRTEQ